MTPPSMSHTIPGVDKLSHKGFAATTAIQPIPKYSAVEIQFVFAPLTDFNTTPAMASDQTIAKSVHPQAVGSTVSVKGV